MPRDGFNFRSGEAISQQRGIFAVEGHFHSPFRSCEMRGRLRNGTRVPKGGFAAAKPPVKWVFGCKNWSFKALGISQPISQLRKEMGGLRNGTRVPRGGFTAAKHLAKFRSSFRSTLRNCLQIAITSSFQLWFAQHLKRWTSNFLIFKTTYSMHKMDSRKCSKCVQQFLFSWISSC